MFDFRVCDFVFWGDIKKLPQVTATPKQGVKCLNFFDWPSFEFAPVSGSRSNRNKVKLHPN